MSFFVETPNLLTKKQAAKYLGISMTKLAELMAHRELAFYKLGPANRKGVAVRFRVNDLEKFLDGCRVRA